MQKPLASALVPGLGRDVALLETEVERSWLEVGERHLGYSAGPFAVATWAGQYSLTLQNPQAHEFRWRPQQWCNFPGTPTPA